MIQDDFGNRRVISKIEGIEHASIRVIRRAFYFIGRDLKSAANKEILRKPKGGRTYIIRTRSGRRRRHVASAAGETHANLSGRLRRSLGYQVNGHTSLSFGYGVEPETRRQDSSRPFYGNFVEFGTRRMAARPSLQNAIRDTLRNSERHFENEFKNESS